jgi:membrane protease YdiL (CAAX protease family)
MHPGINQITDSKVPVWGLWATIGWGLLVIAVLIFVQGLVLAAYIAFETAKNPDLGFYAAAKQLEVNGFIMAIAIIAATPCCLGLIALLVRFRGGPSVRRYLSLETVAPRTMLTWLGVLALFAVICDLLAHWSGRPRVPDFMADAYVTAYFPLLFWVALVIAAPLFEEVFFRGFLFEGFQFSRLGPGGTILLTSLSWTVLHVQYGSYELITIFILGIVFGIARLKTKSIYPPLAMHSLFNLFALIQLAAYSGSV